MGCESFKGLLVACRGELEGYWSVCERVGEEVDRDDAVEEESVQERVRRLRGSID